MTDSTTPQDDAAMPPASTGSVGEPAAWVVGGPDGPRVFLSRDEAKRYMHDTLSMDLMCLYKQQPMRLTVAEREAVEVAVEYVGSAYQVEHHAAVLRGLLERTK